MDKYSLDVEFPIDNDRLKRESAEAKTIISGVGETAEVTAERAGKRMGDAFDKPIQKVGDLERNVASLKIQLQSYEAIVEKSFDSKVIAQYNQKIEETKNQIAGLRSLGKDSLVPMEQGAAKTKSNFNGLQNSINQISRELPAFTYSAQTGFMGISNNIPILADEIGRLRKQNEALVASGQKGVPIWKQLVGGLFSWGTALSLGVTLITIFGKEIGNLFTALFKGKDAIDAAKERLKALNETLKDTSFQKTIAGVSELRINLDLAKKGMADKEAVVKQYNETIGKTAGQVKDLDGVEKGLVANADNYIKMTLYKAAANLQLAEAAKRAAEIQENALKSAEEFANVGDKAVSAIGAGAGGAGSQFGVAKFDSKQYADNLKRDGEKRKAARKKQLEEEQSAYEKNAAELLNKAAKNAGAMGGKLLGDTKADAKQDKKDANTYAQALERREDLLNKLADLDAEYSRRSFDKDKEELAALKQKFVKARRIVEDFNSDPKNIKVAKVSIASLAPLEQRATTDLVYRQQTTHLKNELDRQKKIFEEYEDYKTKFGAEKANERFKAELKGFESYSDLLKAEFQKTFAVGMMGGVSGDVLKERLLDQGKRFADTQKAEQANYDKLLVELQDYQTKRKLLEETYNKELAMLSEKGKASEIAVLTENYTKELNQLDDANIQKLDSYKSLFEGIERLTDAASRKVIADAEAMLTQALAAGTISAEEAKKIRLALKDTQKSLDNRFIDRLHNVAGAFAEIANNVGGVDTGLGSVLTTVSSIVGATADVKKNIGALTEDIANFKANKADGGGGLMGSISGIAGIAGSAGAVVGTITGVVSSISNFFNKAKEQREQARKEQEAFRTGVFTGELEINQLYRERLRDQVRINELRIEGIAKEGNLIRQQQQENQDDFKTAMAAIGGESFKTGEKKINAQQGRLDDVYASLAGKSFEEIEQLAIKGQLEGKALSIYQSLLKLRQEGLDLAKAEAEVANELSATITATTADNILSGIVQGFKDGKSEIKDFTDTFEEGMKGAIFAAMEAELEPATKDFYKKFAEFSKDGLNAGEIDKLKADYMAIAENGKAYAESMAQVTGIDFSKKTKEAGGTAGAIKGITTDQADLLAGQFGGLRISMIDLVGVSRNGYAFIKNNSELQLDLLRSSYLTQIQIEENTRRTADNTEKLGSMETSLKNIDKKMDSNNAALRAAGLNP
jgi:hypothetical protein